MRKQTKILVATALLALGASFTSMAAAKTGTWNLEDEGWMCYDKDGEEYEDEFCLSYGKEYYVGNDGLLVTSSWVDFEDEYYYVGSDGSKTVNDWRFVAPEDDDDAEAEWFYFDAKGRRVDGKKVIEGKTYYFDTDGVMLTGWVDTSASSYDEANTTTGAVYCDETGARVASQWVKTWAPNTDLEEAEEDDKNWYYIKSTGAVQTGRNRDIEGETYFFGTDGVMLSGWVGTNDDTTYVEMGGENYINISDNYTVYYCGSADQGWAKKDRWIKTWAPAEYYEKDADEDQHWFYLAKSGKVYIPDSNSSSDAMELKFADGSQSATDLTQPAAFSASNASAKITLKEIDKKFYAFNDAGEMLSGFVAVTNEVPGEEATNGTGLYYFGGADDGAMKMGSQIVEDNEGVEYKFFFGKSNSPANYYNKGVGVTGAASGELYENGLIQMADGDYPYEVKTVTVNGAPTYFIVDADGDIRTSQKNYKDEDDNSYLDASLTTFRTSATGALEDSINALGNVNP